MSKFVIQGLDYLDTIGYRLKKKYLIDKFGLPSDLVIKGRVKVSGSFVCGQGCKLVGDINISGLVRVGKYVSINGPNTDVVSSKFGVEIGSYVSIARNVTIQEYNHVMDRPSTYFISKNIFGKSRANDITSVGPIKIGSDVWIGSHSVILSGAEIGHGSVVAANSVVKGVVPPYSIVAGSPAKVIKFRFDEETINTLLSIKWWNWELDRMKRNEDFFCTPLTIESFNKITQ